MERPIVGPLIQFPGRFLSLRTNDYNSSYGTSVNPSRRCCSCVYGFPSFLNAVSGCTYSAIACAFANHTFAYIRVHFMPVVHHMVGFYPATHCDSMTSLRSAYQATTHHKGAPSAAQNNWQMIQARRWPSEGSEAVSLLSPRQGPCQDPCQDPCHSITARNDSALQNMLYNYQELPR